MNTARSQMRHQKWESTQDVEEAIAVLLERTW